MGSPVRADLHAEPDGLVHLWLATFALRCRTARFYPNATVVLDADNTCQPDAVLCLAPEHGGRARINARGYLTGAPELVAEIAASTVSLDMQEKLRVYRRCGVSEYLVWRTAEKQFDWLLLENEEYRRLAPGADGLLRSRVFPGLVLDVGALLARDGARVLAALPLDPNAAAGHAKRG